MVLRVEQRAFQSHEPPALNVGLRGVELLSQTLEPVLLIRARSPPRWHGWTGALPAGGMSSFDALDAVA